MKIIAMFATYIAFIANMNLGKYFLVSSILICNFILFMNNFIYWMAFKKAFP